MDYDYLKNKKILLVDDEQELLQMISSFLYRMVMNSFVPPPQ